MTVDVRIPSQAQARVWLNGTEVTRWCVYADDQAGKVELWKHSENGAILAPGELEAYFGDVLIQLPQQQPWAQP